MVDTKHISETDTITVPIGSMNKQSFTLLLSRLLDLSRHYGISSSELFTFITNRMKRADLNQDLTDIHNDLHDSMLRAIVFTPWEQGNEVMKWSCMIEYGFGQMFEGINGTPEKALDDAMFDMDEYLKGE
jgi:hypothetical protein